MREYIAAGELASLYYALQFLGENLAASRDHVKELQELLINQYCSQQPGETRRDAILAFDEWRSSGDVYIGNPRGAGRKRYKLTAADIEDIKQAKTEGQSTKSLAAKYNVSDRYIRKL